ncbi:putative tRNA (uracil-O(2)-)-methyltransferase [Zancudomyces culisetae]|uniref:tRNA (uracil-O(2)-)-methyltransferase n=1 Tax=Zancudomyces culisetae TaxID=1213189 RepID=A0A1R1PZE7_ZANCU|nr:putative tRNA (uracil-O(2)-)-methyltransferase [Zancudomyces culisetae]|eukprot:OMH86342.1 putative tRNA (uracil-O(2)-)-methyltransferase [Zancudomyces culisetae]
MWEKDDKESKSNSLEQNQQEGGEGVERPYFVDVGCGNGLLVYILNSEGYPGYGVDQASRKIWKTITGMNKEDCPQANLCGHTLIEQDVIPYEYTTNARWLIGNHPDELTPWMPIIAAKSDFAK